MIIFFLTAYTIIEIILLRYIPINKEYKHPLRDLRPYDTDKKFKKFTRKLYYYWTSYPNKAEVMFNETPWGEEYLKWMMCLTSSEKKIVSRCRDKVLRKEQLKKL